jgi:hypothetical protein
MKQIGEKLTVLLQGKIPVKIDIGEMHGEARELAEKVNRLIDLMQEIHAFILPLSKGELGDIVTIGRNNYLASPFKELHSRLLHLTWQAGQVAQGDYSQRVDFMGDFSKAFNAMVISLDKKERALRQKIADLERAATHIKKLEGILPICASCKKIRKKDGDPKNEEGWVTLEAYIEERTNAIFSHSFCPRCVETLYPELRRRKGQGDVE